MRVAILGAGLAGMVAAKAVMDAGGKVEKIITDKLAGGFPGFVYLEEDLGLGLKEQNFIVKREGSKEVYAQKRQGLEDIDRSSWDKFPPKMYRAYNPKEAYVELLRIFGPVLEYDRFEEGAVESRAVLRLLDNYDLVISTIPKPTMFPFLSYNGVEGLLVKTRKALNSVDKQVVIYNGDYNSVWSRVSNLWGERWYEYYHHKSSGYKVEISGRDTVIPTVKPNGHSGTAYVPENLILEGRLGRWERSRKVIDTYYRVYGKIKENSTKNS